MSEDLVAVPFGAVRAALDTRSLRAVELTEAYLERVEAGAALHAYVTVDAEGAAAAAAAADRELDAGARRGPLHGIPIGIKDSYAVAGLPMTCGSPAFADVVPAVDGETAAAARSAGAVILGTHALHEAGMGDAVRDGPGANGRNPRHPDYVPGGSSSGGAAATAAGLCLLAIGGDSGGSVRNPAAACGVVGVKPTYGRIPTGGGLPYCWSIDHAGVFARDVEAAAAGLAALAGGAAAEPLEQAPRLAVVGDDDLGDVAPEVREVLTECSEAFAAAGAELVAASRLALEEAGPAWWGRLAEMYPAHAVRLVERPDLYSPGIRALLERSRKTSPDEYLASWETAWALRARVEAVLETADALLLPANPWPGLRWEEWPGPKVFDWYRFCYPFNLTGQPAITLPWTLGPGGMPVSYQLVGRRDADERLLALAAWCEAQGSFDSAPIPLPAERPLERT